MPLLRRYCNCDRKHIIAAGIKLPIFIDKVSLSQHCIRPVNLVVVVILKLPIFMDTIL